MERMKDLQTLAGLHVATLILLEDVGKVKELHDLVESVRHTDVGSLTIVGSSPTKA